MTSVQHLLMILDAFKRESEASDRALGFDPSDSSQEAADALDVYFFYSDLVEWIKINHIAR